MSKSYYVYILTNKGHTTFYIGFTGKELNERIWEHKNKLVKGFTSTYNLNKLIYYEIAEDPESAIAREKQLKNWSREKKLKLITKLNPSLKDLYDDISS